MTREAEDTNVPPEKPEQRLVSIALGLPQQDLGAWGHFQRCPVLATSASEHRVRSAVGD